MAFRSAGAVSAAFTVVDEFSGPLQAAFDQVKSLQMALGAASADARGFGAAMVKIGAALDGAAPAMEAMSRALKAAMPVLRGGMADAAVSAAALDGSVKGAAAAVGELKSAAAGVSTPFTKMASASERLDSALASADTRIGVLADKSAAVAASSKEAATAFRAAGSGGGGIGGAGGGGAAGGGGEEAAGGGYLAGRLGKIGGRALSIPGLGLGFAVYESVKQAIETNYHAGAGAMLFDPAAATNPAVMAADTKIMTALAQSSAIGTIFTTAETEQAYGLLAGILSTAPPFQGPDKWKNFSALAPIILRASEVASMRGLGSLPENMTALTWYAHLTGAYDPTSMTAASNQLLAIAERTGVKLPRLERTMSYAVPVARGAGADMGQTALLTAALIQGGLGQRAGYAVGQIITGLLQTGGPVTAALQANIHAVNGALFTGKELSAHLTALHTLGLVDAHGQVTALNAKGGVDLAKLAADIEAAGKRMSPTAFANAVHAAFGIRGMRGADLLSAMQALLPAFFKSIAGTPGAAAQQALLAQSPLQQLEQVWARLQDIGNVLATAVLPDLNKFLTLLVRVADLMDRILPKSPVLAGAAGGAGVGATMGWFIGGPFGAAVGAGIGAGVGAVSNLPQGTPTPKSMPGQSEAGAALLGRPREPQDVHVSVSAPLTLTVQGDMLGNYESLTAFMNQWWGQHAGKVGDAVKQKIQDMQRQSRRSTMQDMQQADGYTAAVASGAGF